MKSLEKLMAERNMLSAQIEGIIGKKRDLNFLRLVEESMNLLDEVGEGFIREDYYANNRYFSGIPGVKNLRIRPGRLTVKVNDRRGHFLPEEIEIRGETYILEFIRSESYG